MISFNKVNLPRKVILSGADCFHLVLDKHAKKHGAGGNVSPIPFAVPIPPMPYPKKSCADDKNNKNDCLANYAADHAICSALRGNAPISIVDKCFGSMAERFEICKANPNGVLPPLFTGGH